MQMSIMVPCKIQVWSSWTAKRNCGGSTRRVPGIGDREVVHAAFLPRGDGTLAREAGVTVVDADAVLGVLR